MDGGLVHGDSGKGLLAGVLAGNHHPKRLGTQILSSLVFLDTTASFQSNSLARVAIVTRVALSVRRGCDPQKEDRPEAADHGGSKTRNQRWIDFLRSTAARPPFPRYLPSLPNQCRPCTWSGAGRRGQPARVEPVSRHPRVASSRMLIDSLREENRVLRAGCLLRLLLPALPLRRARTALMHGLTQAEVL